jgi:hypothetical protein
VADEPSLNQGDRALAEAAGSRWKDAEVARRFLDERRRAIPLGEEQVAMLLRLARRFATGRDRAEVAREYHGRPDRADNILDPVEAQVGWLREIGFEQRSAGAGRITAWRCRRNSPTWRST